MFTAQVLVYLNPLFDTQVYGKARRINSFKNAIW